MKKGTRVSWLIDPRAVSQRGVGVTITDADSDGNVLVAVESLTGGKPPGYKMVIHCVTTWLKVEALPAAPAAPVAPAK
jgi:hypothetical protein